MVNVKKIIVFLILVFAIAWIPFFYAYLSSNEVSLATFGTLLAVMMYAPAISTLIVQRMIYKQPALLYGFGLKKYEYIIIGWLLPVVFALISAGLTVLFQLGKLDLQMTELYKVYPVPDRPVYYVFFLSSLFLPVVLGALFTFGEEIGWRGFLQEELRPLGQIRSYFIIGVIWGIWQVPLIIAGYNYSGHPILGSVYIVMFSVLVSFIFGWLKDKSGSIWASTIAHSSLNGPAVTTLFFITSYNRLIGGMFGLVGFFVIAAFVAYLIYIKQIS